MEELTQKQQDFNDFLSSIGGLVNGYYPNREPILSFGICECDEGWLMLIQNLIKELIEIGWNKEIRQIKEKFASLRFYTNGLPDGGFEIIHKYEELSFQTCEICGSTENVSVKKFQNKNWIRSLCDKHEN